MAVDRQMRTSIDGVWAAGDCVHTHHRLLDEPGYLPLGTTAHKQSRVATCNSTAFHRLRPPSTTPPSGTGTSSPRACVVPTPRRPCGRTVPRSRGWRRNRASPTQRSRRCGARVGGVHPLPCLRSRDRTGPVQHHRDQVAARAVPARRHRPRTLPHRAGFAEVPGPGHPMTRPERHRPGTIGDQVEARPKRVAVTFANRMPVAENL